MQTAKYGIKFFRSYYDAIEELPTEEEQLNMYKAIFRYAFFGETPQLAGMSKLIWTLIKPNLDKSIANSAAGAAARGTGKPGLMGNSNAKTKRKQSENEAANKTKTKRKQNENKAVLSKDKEKEKDMDKDMDMETTTKNSCCVIAADADDNQPTTPSSFLIGKFNEFLERECPTICSSFRTRLTEEQLNKLIASGHKTQEISEMCRQIENNKKYVSEHQDLYASLVSWFKNEKKS